MVTKDEPGERLLVRGRVVEEDGEEPLAGARVYAYQTDARGVYSPEGSENPRLFAHVVTDENGEFQLATIRPASYPGTNIPCHVHYRVEAPGCEPLEAEFLFDDDPLLDAGRRRWARGAGFPIVTVEQDHGRGARCAVTIEVRRRRVGASNAPAEPRLRGSGATRR